MNELEKAFQKFKNAYYQAVKRDMEAEHKEEWEAGPLKKCEEAWKISNELEKKFLELLRK